MRILIIGGGGREHALAWKLKQNPQVTEIHAAPGNAGLAQLGTIHPVKATDLEGILALTKQLQPDLAVVGPDDPLAMGLVDQLIAAGFPAFGPTKAAAQLEWSKSFAKEVMEAAGVPTAASASFRELDQALAYLKQLPAPYVIKADGLAAGKGVFICQTLEEAEAALNDLLEKQSLGEAGSLVVIEEFLTGKECSVLCITDGQQYVTLPAIQDHKRIGEGNTGPNTGGMGTYLPVLEYDQAVAATFEQHILQPLLQEMVKRDTPFKGCLFVGLMLTPNGPKVLECNARFGDPETQVAMAMLDEDLLTLMQQSITGGLVNRPAVVKSGACACVILASQGYPNEYEKGKVITGLKEAEASGALLFHAGTTEKDGQVVTDGGRVLGAVGQAADLKTALDQAYQAVEVVQFEGKYFRRDIGQAASSNKSEG